MLDAGADTQEVTEGTRSESLFGSPLHMAVTVLRIHTARTHTHNRMHTRAHTHTRTHAHTHARAHAHTCTHTHTHTCTHSHTHTRNVCVCVCMCVCACACSYVLMFLCYVCV